MKKILFFALIAFIFTSCFSSQPKFELEVNIRNNASLINKKFVVVQKIDGKVVYTDTTKIKNEQFTLEIPYMGPALMDVAIQYSNVDGVMLASEKGKIRLDIDGVKANFGGTPLNDRLQAYHNETDSVNLLFKQLEDEYKVKTLTPEVIKEFSSKRNQLIIENTDRIVAFIKENVNNQIGEHYFMIHYVTFSVDRKIELNGFATERLKKEFGIR